MKIFQLFQGISACKWWIEVEEVKSTIKYWLEKEGIQHQLATITIGKEVYLTSIYSPNRRTGTINNITTTTNASTEWERVNSSRITKEEQSRDSSMNCFIQTKTNSQRKGLNTKHINSSIQTDICMLILWKKYLFRFDSKQIVLDNTNHHQVCLNIRLLCI